MPMAYAAQMGGVCTLIGTSSNLLADSLAQKQGLLPIGVFEMTKLGALLGGGRHRLPDAGGALAVAETHRCAAAGRTRDRQIRDRAGAHRGFAADRQDASPTPSWAKNSACTRWSCCAANDACGRRVRSSLPLAMCCWCAATGTRSRSSAATPGCATHPSSTMCRATRQPRVLAEMIVAPASPIEGRRFAESGIGWRYNATLLAIHRRGVVLRDKLSDVSLAVGDVLMMLVDEDRMSQLRGEESFIVLSEREDARRMPRKALVAVAIMAAVVLLSGLHWLPIPIAAICGATAMALDRLLRPQGRLRRHRLENHHPARRDPAAGYRDREDRPVERGGAAGHGPGRRARPAGGVADDLPAHRPAHRADGAQPLGGADGRHRGRRWRMRCMPMRDLS